MVAKLKSLLDQCGIAYREEEKSIFIELPNNFGELQIYDLEDNDDLLGLVGSDWHTHSECLGDPDTPKEELALNFISEIFSGKYFLIEEKEPGKCSKRIIEDDLESYVKYLPTGTEYKIYNET